MKIYIKLYHLLLQMQIKRGKIYMNFFGFGLILLSLELMFKYILFLYLAGLCLYIPIQIHLTF